MATLVAVLSIPVAGLGAVAAIGTVATSILSAYWVAKIPAKQAFGAIIGRYKMQQVINHLGDEDMDAFDLLVANIFGAFPELDEVHDEKTNKWTKLRRFNYKDDSYAIPDSAKEVPSIEMVEQILKLIKDPARRGKYIQDLVKRYLMYDAINPILQKAQRGEALSLEEKKLLNLDVYIKGGKIDFSGQYNTLELIDDLRKEVRLLSEELAILIPQRLIKEKSGFGPFALSRYWGYNDFYITRSLTKIKRNDWQFPEKSLAQLEQKLSERLGAKALGCIYIINQYRNSKITGLDFIERIRYELARVSGEIKVTDEEIGLILGGTKGFVKDILAKIRDAGHPDHNPNYKFSLESLDFMISNLRGIAYSRAQKCLDLIDRYKHLNPDLKEYSLQKHKVAKPHFFKKMDNTKSTYWFGFLCADGWLGRFVMGMELSTDDKDHIEKFADAIGIDPDRIKDRIRIRIYKGKPKEYFVSYLQFGCRPMIKELNDYMIFNSKSHRKAVPPVIVDLINEAKLEGLERKVDPWDTLPGMAALAWLLGFYDGDGEYHGGRSASIGAASRELLQEIKELFGIENNVRTDVEPGTVKKVFDVEYISKGYYGLTVGPYLFEKMMNSYPESLDRKRFEESSGQNNYIGD